MSCALKRSEEETGAERKWSVKRLCGKKVFSRISKGALIRAAGRGGGTYQQKTVRKKRLSRRRRKSGTKRIRGQGRKR